MKRNKIILLIFIVLLAFGKIYSQTVVADIVLRANPTENPNLHYYLYNDKGELLKDRSLSKNTTVFTSRYISNTFTLKVYTNDTLLNVWYFTTNPPNTNSENNIETTNYFYSDTNDINLSTTKTVRKYSTINERIPIMDWVIKTDSTPIKGFGGKLRGFLGIGGNEYWVSDIGFGMSDDKSWGKTWMFSKWKNNWYGIVAEKYFLWVNYAIIFKPGIEPEVPIKGTIYFGTDGFLYMIDNNGIKHKILDDRVLDSLYNK